MLRSRKPKSATCETCGREFTEASINMHRRQCTKLQLSRKSRSPGMSEPGSPERVARARSCEASSPTEATAWVVRSYSADTRVQRPKTVPCQICGKNFLYTSIKVHQAQCAQRTQSGGTPRRAAQGCKTARIGDLPQRGKTPPPEQGKTAFPDRSASALKRFVTCHICGQLFGTKSIHCHLPRCAQLWEAREAQKPMWQRQPLPAPAAQSQKGLKAPSAEHRERLRRREVPKMQESLASAARSAIVCHLCGRHFGQASIAMHLPRCQKMWEAREQTKPARERRRVPSAPQFTIGCEQYNQAARKIYQEESAEACPKCGRRLADDKMDLHIASCRVKSAAVSEEDEPDTSRGCPVLVTCHLCGKDFGSASIAPSLAGSARKATLGETSTDL